MRQAADAFEFSRDEELLVSASVVQLMNADLAQYQARDKVPPSGSVQARAAARKVLSELEPPVAKGLGHELESMKMLGPRLATVEDTAKGLAMLVELCACQPWLGLKKPAVLRKQPRREILHKVAIFLGGDTTDEDAREIDKILYPWWAPFKRLKQLGLWKSLLLVGGGVGIGLATGGLAAPAIGGAIGASMGLSGAAAVNAGLATLGGGALATGGLGVAGGTALIGGIGATVGGGVGLASRRFIEDKDVPVAAVEVEAIKLRALVSRLKVHGQSSQAKAQRYINLLQEQIADLTRDLEEMRQKGKDQDAEIELLEKKIQALTSALRKMRGDG